MTWSELNYRLVAINERHEKDLALQCALRNIKYSPRKFKKEKIKVESVDPALQERIEKAMLDSIKNKKLRQIR